jgi:hypothetical protein
MDNIDNTFIIRIDWTCWAAYEGALVDVELIKQGEWPVVLRSFKSIEIAIRWARVWLGERGYTHHCAIDYHQAHDHTHITLYPIRSPK